MKWNEHTVTDNTPNPHFLKFNVLSLPRNHHISKRNSWYKPAVKGFWGGQHVLSQKGLTLIWNSEWVVIIRFPKANAHSTHVYYIVPGQCGYLLDRYGYIYYILRTALRLDMPNISKDTPSTLVSNSFGPFAGTTLECHVAPCRRCVSHTLGRRRCNAWWKYCDPRVGVLHSAENETNTRYQKKEL